MDGREMEKDAERIDPFPVSVIIVSYNTQALLKKQLDFLVYLPCEIIVVDNDSQDETVSMIRDHYPRVELIENRENVGFGKAANQGAKLATSPFFLFLNSDAFFTSEAFDAILPFFLKFPKAAAVGFLLVSENGSPQPSGRPFPTLTFKVKEAMGWIVPSVGQDKAMNPRILSEVDWITGAFMAIRGEAFLEIGGFDERFFLYYEEVDLCHRFKERGWQIFFDPSQRIVHIQAVSSIILADVSTKAEEEGKEAPSALVSPAVHEKESAFLYYQKWGSPWGYLLFEWLFYGASWCKHALEGNTKRKERDLFLLHATSCGWQRFRRGL